MIAGSVSVLMRLANFGVFIGFIVYVYQRYGKEYVNNLIEQDACIAAGLEKERQAVESIYARYKKVINQKEQQRLRLQTVITQWQHVVAQDNAQRMTEKYKRKELLKKKEEHRAQVLYASSIVNTVVPEAVARARHHLVHVFSNEKEGADFTHMLIMRLRESKS